MNAALARIGFNTLAICGSAAFAGVMLSIGLSFGGIWQSMPPEEFSAWFAENNGHVSRPIPYVVLVTTVGLVGSVGSAWKNRTGRRLWLASGACIGVLAIVTFGYFVPTNEAFAEGSVQVADIPSRIERWLSIHTLRIGLSVGASMLGLAAVADFPRSPGAGR